MIMLGKNNKNKKFLCKKNCKHNNNVGNRRRRKNRNKLSTETNAMRNMRIAISKYTKITIPNYMLTFVR
jgi:hypothetical protein